MRYLTLILFLFFALTSFSQQFADKNYYLVDSLVLDDLISSDKELLEECLKNYHKSKHDTSKIAALIPIAENMISSNWEKYQLFQYRLVLKSLKENKDKLVGAKINKILPSIYGNLAVIKATHADYSGAKKYYNKIINLKNVDSTLLATTYSNLAYVYDIQSEVPKSIKLYYKAIAIQQKLNDEKNLAISFNNLGVLYNTQKDFQNALIYFKKAEKIRLKINDISDLGNTYNNIATIYTEYDSISLALEYYNKSLKYRIQINDNDGLASIYNNIGTLYVDNGNYDTAQVYFYKALHHVNLTKNDLMYLSTNYNLAKIFEQKKNYNKALSLSKKGLEMAQEKGVPMYINKFSHSLYSIYESLNNFKQSLEMFKLHILMRDSINNEENTKALIQQQAKYEYEKQKAIDDAEHEKEIAIEQEAKAKQTILTYATGGGLGLVGIFLLIVFNRLKVTRKQKNIIEEQKQEVEHQKEVVEQAHSELEEKNKEITDSIQYAKRIQNAILPPNKVVKEYLQESFILYKPKDIVAGDFYWMESLPNPSEGGANRTTGSPPLGELEGAVVLFAACDCTGHGVPGAMVSVVCNNGLNRSVREYGLTDPGKILDKTREIVVEEFRAGWQAGEKSEEEVKDGMDIALCSLSVDSNQSAVLQYAGAHNPLWLIRPNISNNGDDLKQYLSLTTDNCLLYEIKANKQPIGKFDNPEPYTTHIIELQKGDSVYIFSDGYADQFGGEKGKKMKTVNFKKLLLSIQNENMQKQKELIDEAFESWKGNLEQLDDVCVIGVRIQ